MTKTIAELVFTRTVVDEGKPFCFGCGSLEEEAHSADCPVLALLAHVAHESGMTISRFVAAQKSL